MSRTVSAILITLQSLTLVASVLSFLSIYLKKSTIVLDTKDKEDGDLPEKIEPKGEKQYQFYITYVGVKAKGQKVYGNIISEPHYTESLTEEDIANYRDHICAANPEFKECSILYWTKIEK